MKRACFLIALLVSTGLSQTGRVRKKAPPKPQPTPQSTPQPLFVCPEPAFEQGCRSYRELVAGKGKRLPDENCYVCFRKGVDEFFVISFSTPIYPLVWNETLHKSVLDPQATAAGFGLIESYQDGVQKDTAPPSVEFSGTWKCYGRDPGFFSADEINHQPKDPEDEISFVNINDAQFSTAYKYKSESDNSVVYSLTIQRLTGRFTESFRKETEQGPMIENAGRCVYRK